MKKRSDQGEKERSLSFSVEVRFNASFFNFKGRDTK